MLGLEDFEVLETRELNGELEVLVQTPGGQVMGCYDCGVRAESKGRRTVRVRDLPVSGSPVVLVWRKRLWRCNERLCPVKAWTEPSAYVAPRAVLTVRARQEICRRVGEDADSVAEVARDYGVAGTPPWPRFASMVKAGSRILPDSRVSPPWAWTKPPG